MRKKKVLFLIILIVVVVISMSFIAYRNRTIKGDFISEMLKDNNVTKITITDSENVVVDLQRDQFNEIYELFANSKFKTIYSNTYEISSIKRFFVKCYLENGRQIADFIFTGDSVDALIVYYGDVTRREKVTYRIKNVNWTDELDFLMKK